MLYNGMTHILTRAYLTDIDLLRRSTGVAKSYRGRRGNGSRSNGWLNNPLTTIHV